MRKPRRRLSTNLAKSEGTDIGEYLLLALLVVLILGVIIIHVAHLRIP